MILEHWHAKNSAGSSDLDQRRKRRVTLEIGLQFPAVRDMGDRLRPGHAGDRDVRMEVVDVTVKPRTLAHAGGAPKSDAIRNVVPSYKNRLPNFASQMRVAFLRMVWKTGSNSPGELEITFRTSALAACWSSASCSSWVRRATFVSLCQREKSGAARLFGALRRADLLRRRAFTALPPV